MHLTLLCPSSSLSLCEVNVNSKIHMNNSDRRCSLMTLNSNVKTHHAKSREEKLEARKTVYNLETLISVFQAFGRKGTAFLFCPTNYGAHSDHRLT